MALHKLVNVLAFAGGFFASQKLSFLYESKGAAPVETEKRPGLPVKLKNSDENSFFTEEDKRRLQRAKEDLQKKVCTKHGPCEPPPPKPITESVSDALYDTWLAVKKIPSYWKRTANNISDTICRFFGED